MCLILFSYKNHPQYKLIMASNRDEFYARPTKALSKWGTNKTILSGIDEQSNGTWMGVTEDGRMAAITNYRDRASMRPDAPSRGLLVSNFLESEENPLDYLQKISKKGKEYNGFNLLVGDNDELFYYSNINNKIEEVQPGIHGLSNQFLNTPWPKVERGKKELRKIIEKNGSIDTDEILQLLNNKTISPDNELPDTGIGIEWERALSPIFIQTEIYGTRASSIILIDYENKITFIEKSFVKTENNQLTSSSVFFEL